MLPRLSPSRLVYTTTSRGIERSRAHIPRGTHVTVPSWICVFSDGTPQRRRPAGSETWTCVASQCCCRAAYPCSPASSLYAARNTWKVRNVRTLCFHSYFISLRARAKDAANREYIYIYNILLFARARETNNYRAFSSAKIRAAFSSSCIFHIRCERFAASASHVTTSLFRRGVSVSSGSFSARSFYAKWDIPLDDLISRFNAEIRHGFFSPLDRRAFNAQWNSTKKKRIILMCLIF